MSRYTITATLLLGLFVLVAGASPAQSEDASVSVTCRVQSGDLRFGVLNLSGPARRMGEGVVVINCQNRSSLAQTTVMNLGISVIQIPMHANGPSKDTLTVAFFHDFNRSQAWGDGHNGGQPLRWPIQLAPGEHRLLRLPVFALLQSSSTAPVGAYQVQVPLTITQSVEP